MAETAGKAYVDQQLAGPMMAAQLGGAAMDRWWRLVGGAVEEVLLYQVATPAQSNYICTESITRIINSIGASMNTIGTENGKKVGNRLGNMGIEDDQFKRRVFVESSSALTVEV